MSYGLPYQGSKSKIVKNICPVFPKAENFYDLFGGGFSVTHFMLKHRSKDFTQFHFNEIRKGITELIQDAVGGKYSYPDYKMPWVSREEFHEKKESDSFIKLLWSFGNNGNGYLFGKDVEEYKRSLHQAIVFNEFNDEAVKVLGIKSFGENISIYDRRMFLRNRVVSAIENKGKPRGDLQQLQQLEQLEQLERIQQLEQLEQLERIQQLQQLQQLEQLERLSFYNGDYKKVPIKKDSVIYCDIPYKGTGKYDGNKNFNHKEFFDWAASQTEMVFISEYNVDDKRFYLLGSKDVKSTMASNGATKAVEKLYCNKVAYEKVILTHLKK